MLDQPGSGQAGTTTAGLLLILVPRGRDAEGAAALLGRDGVACHICPDLQELCAMLGELAGAVLVSEEALSRTNLDALSAHLGTQPPWSDLPFIVLTRSGAAPRRALAELSLPEALGNVVFLEYPLNALSLVSAVRSALRARRRQRQVGAHLAERVEAEARLRASEEKLQQTLANARIIGVWDWDVRRNLVQADERCAWLFGVDRIEAAAGMPITAFTAGIHPDDQARVEAEIAHAVATRDFFASEYRVQPDDRTERHVLARGRCAYDDAGDPVHFAGVLIDATEQRQAEERLRLAQRAGGIGTFELDMASQIVTVSEEFCRVWGLPQQDTLPLSRLLDQIHPADRAAIWASYPQALQAALGYHEHRIHRVDTGELRWIARRAEARPDTLPGDGRLVGVAYDITDRKRLENDLRALNETLEQRVAERTAELRMAEEGLRQAQKMEAVGQLTGGIAHDFNNMLQAISGSLEMMQRRVTRGRAAEVVGFLDAARQTVGRAGALTHQLLAFARRQALQPKLVAPDELVLGMAELIQRTVGPGIEVELRLSDGVWLVLCDPNQLESTLLNLAINARDAMPEGGRLTISRADLHLTAADLAGHDDAPPGDYVAIAVADTGVGMAADVLLRAFEPFFTTKPLGEGTGLGLSQIYGFVRQSNGIVRLDSAPGQGTTMRLFLPRHIGTACQESPATKLAAAVADSFHGTVLLVEDEADVRANLVEAIRELGCRVLEAADGPSGLRLIQSRETVDLLVTDVGLPGLNGRQLADAARTLQPDLPVLLITGYAGAALEDWRLEPGMEVLSKPFMLADLLERVGNLLEMGARRPVA